MAFEEINIKQTNKSEITVKLYLETDKKLIKFKDYKKRGLDKWLVD